MMYSREFLEQLYRTIYTIRIFETECIRLYRQGLIIGYFHPYLGEEAIAAGVCAALRPDDYIVSTHRGHGHCIARGGELKKMAAEVLGREAGYCRGRGGSYKVTAGLLDEFGPRRVIDAPISEASFTGAGVGAAITGMRPVVEILFIDFTSLIIDQIVNQAAKYRFMSGGRGRVPMVLRTQGGSGNGLAAQHSQSLEAWYYHVPGLKVVMPSTPYDAKGLLKTAIRDDDPVIFIEHKLLYLTEGPVPQEEYTIELGVGDIKRRGSDVTIITWSNMVPRTLSAAQKLAQEGIEAEVIDLRTLVPLDKGLILDSVRKTEHLVIVQEAVRRGGVASDIASIVQAEAFDYLDAPIEIVAGKNTPIPFNVHLERAAVPQEADITSAVRKVLHL